MRSFNAIDLDQDDNVFEMRTTSRRRLSPYTSEDIIKCPEGEIFMLYVAKTTDPTYDGLFGSVSDVQHEVDLVCAMQRISSKEFYVDV